MLLSALSAVLSLAGSAAAALTYKGVDWSSVPVEEKAGVSYKNVNGAAQSIEHIFRDSGVNTVRQRVWVNPSGGTYNLAYNINLAKRAKNAGLGVYIDFHFSDTWADPAHQAIPSGWPTAIDDLAWKLYNYTLDASNQFHDNGVQPTIISIGNEITGGLLWPTGGTSSWYNIARLLHSASAGIRDSRLNPKPKIMIHLDNGWNWDTQNWWYTNVLKQGPLVSSDFDMMGVSFYPFYTPSATLSALKSSLTNMANRWGKELVVAETDWPSSCPNPAYAFPSDAKNIPFNAAGQSQWIKAVANVVASVPKGKGLFYWEPAWIHNANLGSSCANSCMFSNSGQALSSLSVFHNI
ncbi:putative arabinogalactan endo-1, 4-beta-galactosidase [Neurospora hispaniola]|uniref:Arabinogalactan endo-beta-1,4-galactanase n=1 Tax=Neurospora hispaniola TaxID=588809 RepID=A0AAJ0MTQ1_9PEZI|nr:putative arabinogalactan endo-1, 4-beta-galactosidase [Neurospora hispaniola]